MDWMEKTALYEGGPNGPAALILDTDRNSVGHDKLACMGILPEVQTFIDNLVPEEGSRYVLINAMGASEYYGCFPAGTRVTTEGGPVPIEEVSPGDLVLTHRNRWRKVLRAEKLQATEGLTDLFVQGTPTLRPALTATPNHEVYSVKSEDFRRLRRFLVYREEAGRSPIKNRRRALLAALPLEWRPISTLKRGDLVAVPFPTDEVELPAPWNDPELAFLLGLYAAEGCISRRPGRGKNPRAPYISHTIWVISNKEKGVLERVRAVLAKYGKILQVQTPPQANAFRMTSGWVALAQKAAQLVPGDSLTKHLSPDILHAPRSWQEKFLEGYALGDGCVDLSDSYYRGTVTIVSASYQLLLDARVLLARQGKTCSIYGRHNTKSTWYAGSPTYHLGIGSTQFGEQGASKLLIDDERGYILAPVRRVEQRPEWRGDVYDMTVDEDHSYVCEGIVVHNCNSNRDAFPEASLVHFPSNWKNNAEHDKPLGLKWTYGAPTFYQAGAYCFPAGTQIIAADRSRTPIEEMEVGDEVATPVGHRKVTHVFRRQYKGDGVRLRLRGEFETITATSEHPFRVYQRAQIHCPHGYNRLNPGKGCKGCHDRGPQGPARWLPAQEVLPGDYLLIPVPPHGDETPDPQFAELVGWVASEGYLGKKGDIQFTFSENNQDDIDSVLRCLRAQGVSPAAQRIPQYNTVHITVCSRDLSERLRVYVEGVLAEKHLTGEVLRWDRDSLLRLLGAYIDGDGHVCGKGRNHGQLRIRSSSVQMLRSLADVIRALGVAATLQWDVPPGVMESPTNHRLYAHNGSGVVAVSAAWASDLLAYSRKRTNALPPKKSHGIPPLDGFFLAQVTEREDVELDEEVFNLEVEEEHTYVAGEVWVHNCHHQNKDFNKRIGDVAFVTWNDFMKRVELVGRLEEGRSHEHGGAGFWRSLDNGGFPSVSMGARVKLDRCSVCTDLDAFYKALATFDPSRHAHPGMAVLEVHNKIRESKGLQKGEVGGIRGIGRTRAEYCPCMKERSGQIDPKTGLQIFVYNDFPLFFDISLVFVGADRTAKVMKHLGAGTMTKKGSVYVPRSYDSPVQIGGSEKIASDEHREQVLRDAEERVRKLREPHRPKGEGAAVPVTGLGGKTVEEALRNFDNFPTTVEIKTASSSSDIAKKAEEVKRARLAKRAEMDKRVDSQFSPEAIPTIARGEGDLPKNLLKEMSNHPLPDALATAGSLGIVLRPREYQRVVLVQMGMDPLADQMDHHGQCFGYRPPSETSMSLGTLVAALAKKLVDYLPQRSGHAPFLRSRMDMAIHPTRKDPAPSPSNKLMDKLASDYQSYRQSLMQILPTAQHQMSTAGDPVLTKVAAMSPEEIYNHLSYAYFRLAFQDEVAPPTSR